jgi:ribosomal protein L37E
MPETKCIHCGHHQNSQYHYCSNCGFKTIDVYLDKDKSI